MYDPIQSDDYNEYIEIYNNENITLNLTGWRLCTNKLLLGYINNVSGQNLLANNLTLEPFSYAIITDGGSGTLVYSNFNVSNYSLALHVDGAAMCGRLDNTAKNISIMNDSGSIIDNLFYNESAGWPKAEGGKSLQKINVADSNIKENWCVGEPTPGSANICTSSTPQPSNSTPPSNSTNSSDASIYLKIELDEDEIINSEEFDITIKAYNLKNQKYNFKIWIEFEDNETIISDRYGKNSKGEDVWTSGIYYIYNFFSGPGNKTEDAKLKIRESYKDFKGDAKLFFKLEGEGEYYKSIEIFEKENNSDTGTSGEISEDNENIQNTLALTAQSSGVIKLGNRKDGKTSSEGGILYESSSEKIKKYAIYVFSLLLVVFVVILIKKKL